MHFYTSIIIAAWKIIEHSSDMAKSFIIISIIMEWKGYNENFLKCCYSDKV